MQIKVHGLKSLVCGTYVDDKGLTHEVEIAVLPEVGMQTWNALRANQTDKAVTFASGPESVIVDRLQTLGDYGYNDD